MLLYSLGLSLVLILGAPWWLLRMFTTQRYREGLRERFGQVPAALREQVQGKRIVWLHAVSVGEVLAASSLIAELEQTLGSGWDVIISTTTRTGQQLARKRFGTARVFYFPLDFRFAVRAWLDVLRPELLILTESELWPRLLHECALAAIHVAVVNARVSDRTLRRTVRFKGLWMLMARHVTVWLAQSDEDAARLLRLGIEPARVQTTGNLKYDTRPPHDSALVTAIRSAAAGRLLVVAGSTVHYGTTPEEALVLEAFRTHIWPEMPGVLLILAPRHPQRFSEVGVLAAGFGTTLCATKLLPASPPDAPVSPFRERSVERPTERITERILVLDTIGDLAALYRIANVAFVGGSLLPHGGHNPLEPAQFGVPVVMGPHVQNFRDIVAHLQAADGMLLLESTDPGPLGEALAQLLADPARATVVGERGRTVCEGQKGATGRTVAALLPLLAADAQQKSLSFRPEAPPPPSFRPEAPPLSSFRPEAAGRSGETPVFRDASAEGTSPNTNDPGDGAHS